MPARLFTVLAFALAAVLGLGALPASASTSAKSCYKQSDDADADGYARTGAASVTVQVSGLNCPSGYVKLAGDCADNNAAVHPRRSEVPFNNVDDDCANGADEAEPIYSAGGNGNTTSGFRITVRLNDADTTSPSGGLYGQVAYSRMSATGTTSWTSRQPLTVSNFHGSYFTSMNVTGLAATTVYKAQLHLYNGRTLLDVSDYYFTTTDGTTQKSLARTRIVLKGFKEMNESDRGLVGYRGTAAVAGTRYGASSNELWCSEFYVWTAKNELQGLGGRDTVSEIVSYFSAHGAYYTSPSAIRNWGDRGDYVAIDTNDDGKKNHSGMFLAYDAGRGTVWTLEGNTSNTVGVRERSIGTRIKGLGHIVYSQLP
jgi:hypothetical protein